MSKENEEAKTSEIIEITEVAEEPQGLRDWDGNLIEIGDTVFFNDFDSGTVLDEEKDGRICIESEEKSADSDHPWPMVWLIPPGLLKKEKPKEEKKVDLDITPSDRGCCNR